MKKNLISYLKKIVASTKALKVTFNAHNKVQNLKVRKLIDGIISPIGFINLQREILQKDKFNAPNSLAIAIIIKNEAPYIQEWIEYHIKKGFKKIYLYDNESTDNLVGILQKYIATGVVEYKLLPGVARQMDAYNDALRKSRKKREYLMFLDADEFVFLKRQTDNFLELVNEYFSSNSSIGGLAINWVVFGSSGFIEKTPGLVTQKYVMRSNNYFEVNKHVKTICDPRKVAGVLNPHYPEYLPNYYAVNLQYEVVEGAFSKHDVNARVRINHYFTKSKEEFEAKKSRGMADSDRTRKDSEFALHDRNEVRDESMHAYGEYLNRRCNNG